MSGDRKPSKRDSGGAGPMLYVLAGVAAFAVWRNAARISPALHHLGGVAATAAAAAAAPAAVLAAVAAAVAAVTLTARTVQTRRRTTRLQLGRKHLAALRSAGLAKNTTDADGKSAS